MSTDNWHRQVLAKFWRDFRAALREVFDAGPGMELAIRRWFFKETR